MSNKTKTYRNPQGIILLLDIDETLLNQGNSTMIKSNDPAKNYPHISLHSYHFCWIRPRLNEFLKKLDQHEKIKEIWACTTGEDANQTALMKKIKLEEYDDMNLYDFFDGHIFRSFFQKHKMIVNVDFNSVFYKDTRLIASKFDWDYEKTLLIDDDLNQVHEGNMIKISPFEVWGFSEKEKCDNEFKNAESDWYSEILSKIDLFVNNIEKTKENENID